MESIRTYYDRNTRLFLRFGSSQELQTIHRALWPDGVTSLPQALKVANEMILAAAQAMPGTLCVADLGCGVGASLLHLLGQLPAGSTGFGLTLSPLQAQLGGKIFRAKGLPGLISEADFQRLPLAAGFDLAYAVESFVHAIEPGHFMAEAARILRPADDGKPGGRLIVIDDFLGMAAGVHNKNWLELYRRGWNINTLASPEGLALLAAEHGLRLVEDRLLTPWLRLRALPDLAAAALASLFSPFLELHPIIPSMLGSMALQKCLKDGTVEYRWLVFERV